MPSGSSWRFLAERRISAQVGSDVAAWTFGLVSAMLLRFDFELGAWQGWHLITAIAAVAALQVVGGYAFGLYVGRWKFGSFDEVAALARTVLCVVACFGLLNRFAFDERLVPMSVSFGSGLGALLGMTGTRYLWRSLVDRRLRPSSDAKRVLVFGAGEGGNRLITAMMRDPNSEFVPVALLDDDRAKNQLRLLGVPVVGDRTAISEAAKRFGAEMLVVAIPSANSALLRELAAFADAAGLAFRVVPAAAELLQGRTAIANIRPANEVDLLGRQFVETDVDEIAGYLTGRRILVTGAGGSIGAELCRQLHKLGPAQLVMLDRDESALHRVQMSIEGRALLDSRNLVVADIRDPQRILDVFDEHRPEVVFHAAALKHLPLLEMHLWKP